MAGFGANSHAAADTLIFDRSTTWLVYRQASELLLLKAANRTDFTQFIIAYFFRLPDESKDFPELS